MAKPDIFKQVILGAGGASIEDRPVGRVGIVPEGTLTRLIPDSDGITVHKEGLDNDAFIAQIVGAASKYILPSDGVSTENVRVVTTPSVFDKKPMQERLAENLQKLGLPAEFEDGTVEVPVSTDMLGVGYHVIFSPKK